MSKIRVKQIRSAIDCNKRQKNTLRALGIKKLNVPRELEPTSQVLGMIEKVKHLLHVENINP